MLTLSVEKRDKKVATLSSLRLAGSIPGVVYGAHQSSTPITLNAKAFAKKLKSDWKDADKLVKKTVKDLK